MAYVRDNLLERPLKDDPARIAVRAPAPYRWARYSNRSSLVWCNARVSEHSQPLNFFTHCCALARHFISYVSAKRIVCQRGGSAGNLVQNFFNAVGRHGLHPVQLILGHGPRLLRLKASLMRPEKSGVMIVSASDTTRMLQSRSRILVRAAPLALETVDTENDDSMTRIGSSASQVRAAGCPEPAKPGKPRTNRDCMGRSKRGINRPETSEWEDSLRQKGMKVTQTPIRWQRVERAVKNFTSASVWQTFRWSYNVINRRIPLHPQVTSL